MDIKKLSKVTDSSYGGNDGWDTGRFSEFIKGFDDLSEAIYEVKNCVRGPYTGCHTYDALVGHFQDILDAMSTELSYVDTEEDPIDEDEVEEEDDIDEDETDDTE